MSDLLEKLTVIPLSGGCRSQSAKDWYGEI